MKFKTAPATSDLARIGNEGGAAALKPLGRGNWYILDSSSQNVTHLMANLAVDAAVAHVEPDEVGYASGLERPHGHRPSTAPARPMQGGSPNDPDFINQWALENTGQTLNGVTGTAGDDINALGAWSYVTGSSGIAIAHFDTGIFYNLPDIAANVWTAPSSYTINAWNQNFNCPQGAHGFSSAEDNQGCGQGQEEDFFGHGTSTASIIGAVGNNGTLIAGENWTTNLISMQVFDNDDEVYDTDVYYGIEAALQIKQQFPSSANIKIMDFGMQFPDSSQLLSEELNVVTQDGILVVADTGDFCQSTAYYPAAYDMKNEIGAAASDQNDNPANWGGGSCTDGGGQIAAPGTSIENLYGDGSDGYNFNGTSASGPFVAGAAALVMDACPNLALDGVIWTLEGQATSRAALAGVVGNQFVSGARLNAGSAVSYCTSGGSTSGTGSVTVTLRLGDGGQEDTGTVKVYVGNQWFYYDYDTLNDNASSIAEGLAEEISSGGSVDAVANGGTISLSTFAKGKYTGYQLIAEVQDNCDGQCGPYPTVRESGANLTAGH